MKKLFIRILSLIMVLSLWHPITAFASNDDIEVKMTVTYMQSEARKQFEMINDFRTNGQAWYWNADNVSKVTNYKASALTYDYALEKIAMQRVAELIVNYDHTRPNGEEPWTAYVGYQNTGKGENIAMGYTSAKWVFNAFKEEDEMYEKQGHRRNMLNNTFTAVGFAMVKCNGIVFTAQEFSTTVGDAKYVAPNDSEIEVTIPISKSLASIGGYNIDSKVYLRIDKGYSFENHAWVAIPLSSGRNEMVYFDPIVKIEKSDAVLYYDDGTVLGKKVGTVKAKAGINANMDNAIAFEIVVIKDNPQAMFRLYNPNSGEHFYTNNKAEQENLVKVGWKDEGVSWYAPDVSNTPVYRLYNPNNGGEHHYTPDFNEKTNLEKAGWKYEGVGWYSEDFHEVALYRLYNPNAIANNHHYTTNETEKNHLISLGWKDEGFAWYGLSK